ncbi:MAG TPA: bifunctional diaminohydroxyphosphoribosylaminopyrimidine deaminase/5-amino-6-(5-phosphoribosylamino)uracil reductase RibD [Flavobacteriaceae bacterium]|nr:bifunctional diaminohydroxyphosphoribosylaminopyrimidine deaminase/5-amino-6-(5-phosphoribosylamino)uracil reductase RibD [Flavobacteriaceae bacterium]
MNIHEKYINRCIEIAKNGLGSTRPNPMVGCVIVLNDTIIGEGFTSAYGDNHAEVNAIVSVKDKSLLKSATLYVTLEPCSHFGKTPPCSDLIIKHQIPKVVIGTKDIHSKVAGKGIEKLKNSGCQVMVGVLEDQCKDHHKRFFTFHDKKRPFIILKWAQTQDGFIAPKTRDEQKPVWITNEYSRQLTHKWRTEEQAILVGKNTVLEDNPSLTARNWKGQNPIRVVLDKNETLHKAYNIFNNDAQTLLIKETKAEDICKKLYQANINSVIIEGGAKTLQLFINAGLWDEARIFIGNNIFKKGIKTPQFSGNLISEQQIADDVLKIYSNN